MTLPNFRLAPQNFHDEAALTTQYDYQPGFPATNTQNTARDATWKGNGIVTQWLRGVWPDDGRKLNCFYLFRHNWHGGTVQIQLYNQPDWTGLVYDSGEQETVNLITLGNFDWGTDALGIVRDPFVKDSPFWLFFTSVGAKSYQITFRDTHVQVRAVNLEVGRIFLGNYLEVGLNTPTVTMGFQDNTNRARTRGGSLRTNAGSFWRTLQIQLPVVFEEDRAAWIDITQHAMTGFDVVAHILPDDSDPRLERDYVLNGKMSTLDPLGRTASRYRSASGFALSGGISKNITIEEN